MPAEKPALAFEDQPYPQRIQVKSLTKERVSLFQPWGPNLEKDTKAFVQQVVEDSSREDRTRFVFAIMNKEDNKMIGAGERSNYIVYSLLVTRKM